MEAFGPRTLLVAAAMHALIQKHDDYESWEEVAEEAITLADACLDRMALDRTAKLCTRSDGHDGPCNGLPREQCPIYIP
jgi:hypothetical protein